ncbi:MAG: hypothetical protein IPI46_08050 [Bacteroidetes bacterium]|nr:hypothetical protein [Bacteroidota bacterium]
MQNRNLQTGNIFVSSLITTIKHALIISTIGLAWGLKFSGLALTKLGETLERITNKTNR